MCQNCYAMPTYPDISTPDDEDNTLLRNVWIRLTRDVASYPRKWSLKPHRCENLKAHILHSYFWWWGYSTSGSEILNLRTKKLKLLSSMSFPLRRRNQKTIPRNSQLRHHCSGYFNHWRWWHYVASKDMYPITQRCMSYPRRTESSSRDTVKWLISHLNILFFSFITATTSEHIT
jgi:hypothetical protein